MMGWHRNDDIMMEWVKNDSNDTGMTWMGKKMMILMEWVKNDGMTSKWNDSGCTISIGFKSFQCLSGHF